MTLSPTRRPFWIRCASKDRCIVFGWSGGGPHALACAARLPSAVAAVIIASVAPYDVDGFDWLAGMGEDNVTEFSAAIAGEETLRPVLEAQAKQMRDVSGKDVAAAMETLLPDVDRAVLTGEFAEDLAANFHESVCNGIDGWLDDDLAFVRPWGFGLDEIALPTMLWQGSLDLMVPFAHGQWLARQLPRARAHLEHGEGHLSIGVGALDRMLDEVLAAC